MDQKDIEHLEKLLAIDFYKHIRNRMQGYCKRCYNIAKANSLHRLTEEIEKTYLLQFKNNINN